MALALGRHQTGVLVITYYAYIGEPMAPRERKHWVRRYEVRGAISLDHARELVLRVIADPQRIGYRDSVLLKVVEVASSDEPDLFYKSTFGYTPAEIKEKFGVELGKRK